MTRDSMPARGCALVLGFPEYDAPARRLARHAALAYRQIGIHHFPDGESRVRLPEPLADHVILCRSLNDPNAKLIELMLAARTARELGASRVSLVAPYLCYMRQDKAFHPGESVSQRIVGAWLASLFDSLLTVDPHLHRVRRLADAVPLDRARALSATGLMSDFLAGRLEAPMLLGPDAESEQWVAAIAADRGLDYAVARKQRGGDRKVRIRLPDLDCSGRDVVLVDDVASTGQTLREAARALALLRPASISVLVTHALFVGDALERLRKAGVHNVWSTDSIVHPSNVIELAPLLAGALGPLP